MVCEWPKAKPPAPLRYSNSNCTHRNYSMSEASEVKRSVANSRSASIQCDSSPPSCFIQLTLIPPTWFSKPSLSYYSKVSSRSFETAMPDLQRQRDDLSFVGPKLRQRLHAIAVSAPDIPKPVYMKEYPLGSKHKLTVSLLNCE